MSINKLVLFLPIFPEQTVKMLIFENTISRAGQVSCSKLFAAKRINLKKE
jgi:hypothetical protein